MRASTWKMMLRSTDHVCKCKERYHPAPHPTPPHPIPWCCVAATMCASTRKMMLRSTDHVCKCKERYHPPPHPTPPHPMMLHSSDHVCKCKERYHPPPHPTMWIPGKPPVPRVKWLEHSSLWHLGKQHTTEPVVQPFNRMDFPSKTCTGKAPCCHLPPSGTSIRSIRQRAGCSFLTLKWSRYTQVT